MRIGLREDMGGPLGVPDELYFGMPESEHHRLARLEVGIGGAGGSFAYGDSATGIGFALTKNQLTMDFSAVGQISEIVNGAV